jgi:hypothetical protein
MMALCSGHAVLPYILFTAETLRHQMEIQAAGFAWENACHVFEKQVCGYNVIQPWF